MGDARGSASLGRNTVSSSVPWSMRRPQCVLMNLGVHQVRPVLDVEMHGSRVEHTDLQARCGCVRVSGEGCRVDEQWDGSITDF